MTHLIILINVVDKCIKNMKKIKYFMYFTKQHKHTNILTYIL